MEMMKKCPRCSGRGKLYRTGSGWSLIDCGGVLETCPCCAGERRIKDVGGKSVEEVKKLAEPEALVLTPSESDKMNAKPAPKKKMGKPKAKKA